MRGKIEEVHLPVPQVDIIVSEWMGYCLFFEAMFDSVIWARDHYLTPNGLMVPSHATLNIAPLSDPNLVAEHIDFWHDVYGFKMSSMLENVYDEALIRSIDPSGMAGAESSFLQLDLHTTKQTELDFVKQFTVTIKDEHDMLDGWVIWFDIYFMSDRKITIQNEAGMATKLKKNSLVSFTTRPDAPQTHWQQGVLLIDRKLTKARPLKDGEVITGNVAYRKRNKQSRGLDMEVSWNLDQNENPQRGQQVWSLGW